jgi:hypothetical protein
MYFLHALLDRSSDAAVPLGYELVRFGWVLRLDKEGRFVSMTEHPYKPKNDQRIEAAVPATDRTANIRAKAAMDDATYLFGVAGRDPKARHSSYMSLMRDMAKVSPVASIVHRFFSSSDRPILLPKDGDLDAAKACHPDPTKADVVAYGGTAKERILVEVDGHPKWWLAPEVQRWHLGYLDKTSAKTKSVRGTCSLCLEEDVILAERMGKSTLGGTMSSANQSSMFAYGRKNAYTAPTCEGCAARLVQGLDDLKSMGRAPLGNKDIHFLWWTEDRSAQAPWSVFDHAMDKDRPMEERLAALESLQDGHLAVIEKTGNAKLGLRRYGRLKAPVVRAGFERWVRTMRTTPWHFAMLLQGRDLTGSAEHDSILEMILIGLLLGESMPMLLTHKAKRKVLRGTDEMDIKIFKDFLRFAGEGEEDDVEQIVEPAADPDQTYPIDTASVDLICSDGLSAGERYALFKGRAFAEAELMQRSRTPGGPQRTIGHTVLRAASMRPSRADDVILMHGSRKTRKGDLVYPDRLRRLQELADQELVMPPLRFSPSEQAQFMRGYRLQHAERRKEIHWYIERKKSHPKPSVA